MTIRDDLLRLFKCLKYLNFCILGQFLNDHLYFLMISFVSLQPLLDKG